MFYGILGNLIQRFMCGRHALDGLNLNPRLRVYVLNDQLPVFGAILEAGEPWAVRAGWKKRFTGDRPLVLTHSVLGYYHVNGPLPTAHALPTVAHGACSHHHEQTYLITLLLPQTGLFCLLR